MPRHDDLMKGMIAFILYNGQVYSTHPLDMTNSPMNLLDDLLMNQYLPPEDVEAVRSYLQGVSTPPAELQLVGRYHMITDKITGYGPDNGSANQEFVRSQLRGTFRAPAESAPQPVQASSTWKLGDAPLGGFQPGDRVRVQGGEIDYDGTVTGPFQQSTTMYMVQPDEFSYMRDEGVPIPAQYMTLIEPVEQQLFAKTADFQPGDIVTMAVDPRERGQVRAIKDWGVGSEILVIWDRLHDPRSKIPGWAKAEHLVLVEPRAQGQEQLFGKKAMDSWSYPQYGDLVRFWGSGRNRDQAQEGYVVAVTDSWVQIADREQRENPKYKDEPMLVWYADPRNVEIIEPIQPQQNLFARRTAMPTNPALMNRLKFVQELYQVDPDDSRWKSHHLRVHDNGKPIGYVLFVTDDTFPEYAKIRDLRVDEEYQRQGVATRLVDELFARYPSAEHDDDFSPEGAAWLEVYDPSIKRWAKRKSRGFLVIAANVAELAANMKQRLFAREDIAIMNQPYLDIPAEPSPTLSPGLNELVDTVTSPNAENPKYNPAMVKAIEYALNNLPDELYKFFPWVVTQVKKGNWFQNSPPPQLMNRTDQLHNRDILWQAFNHMEYLRTQPKNSPNHVPIPDINQMTLEQLEAWVYERNALGLDVSGSVWEETEPVYKFQNGWAIWPVRTENDLKREGDAMGHCVGGYCNQVKAGSTTIWSLRDPQLGSHTTIELEPTDGPGPAGLGGGEVSGKSYNVIQVQGKANAEPKPEYKEMVREWFQSLIAQGVNIEVTVDVSDAYDLQHMSGGLGEYGVPTSVTVGDINYLAESVVEDAISGSADSMWDHLDGLVEENHIDAEQMTNALNQEAYKKIEEREYEFRRDWEDRRDTLRRDYDDYVQAFEAEQDELEAQAEDDEDEDAYDFQREEPEDFDEWLEENGNGEYSEYNEPDFEEQAKEDIGWGIDDAIDRYRYRARSSWKLARRLLDHVDKVGIKDFCPNCNSEHPKTMYLPKDLSLHQSINGTPICRDCVTTLLDYAEAVRTAAPRWRPEVGELVDVVDQSNDYVGEAWVQKIDSYYCWLKWPSNTDPTKRHVSRWYVDLLRPHGSQTGDQQDFFSKKADASLKVGDRVHYDVVGLTGTVSKALPNGRIQVEWDDPKIRKSWGPYKWYSAAAMTLIESRQDALFAKAAATLIREIDPFTTPVLVEMGFGANEEPYEVVFPDTEMETLAYNAYAEGETPDDPYLIGSVVFMPLTDESQINAIKQFGYEGPVTWVEWIYVRPEYRTLEAFAKLTEPVRQYAAENNMPIAAHFQNEQLQRVVDRFLKRPVTAGKHDEFEIGDRVVPSLALLAPIPPDRMPAGTIIDKRQRGDMSMELGHRFMYLVEWDENWMNQSDAKALLPWHQGFMLAHLPGENLQLFGAVDLDTLRLEDIVTNMDGERAIVKQVAPNGMILIHWEDPYHQRMTNGEGQWVRPSALFHADPVQLPLQTPIERFEDLVYRRKRFETSSNGWRLSDA